MDLQLQQSRKNLYRTVFVLALPAIIEMILQTAVGVVDTAMVGRIGSNALAGVGLGNQIMMLFNVVLAAIGTGTTALVARLTGANQPREAGKVAEQAVYIAIAIALLVMAILIPWSDNLLALFFKTTDSEVIELGSVYVSTVALALVFNYSLILINGTLRGAGDTRTPMRITLVVNAINIIGNYFLIYGIGPFPELGVQGAALSTAFSHMIGGILAFLSLLRSPKIAVRFGWRIHPDLQIIKRILRIGIPAALEQGSMRVGGLIYTILIASLGTVSYAAHQVALNAESLSFNPGFGFSLAATTLVGQRLGAMQAEEAGRSGHAAVHMAMVIMAIMGVVFFFFAEQIVWIFNREAEVVELASICLRIVAIAQPALAAQMVYSGALRGAGDTKGILWITLSGFFVIRLSLSYVLAIVFQMGLVGAWIAMVIDLYFRATLSWLRFHKGSWKSLEV